MTQGPLPTTAGGDSLSWAPVSLAFGVLQVLGRGVGGWMEAALRSTANCFVVPFRPRRWAQALRTRGPKRREWKAAHQSSLGFDFAVTGKTWMNLAWHFLVFSCLLTHFLLFPA